MAGDAEAGQAAGGPAPTARSRAPPTQEAHPGQPQRRGVDAGPNLMATVLPPQRTETSRARAAPGASRSRAGWLRATASDGLEPWIGVGIIDPMKIGLIGLPQERQDDAVQSAHRLQRGDLALRRRARRAAHRRRARARPARGSADARCSRRRRRPTPPSRSWTWPASRRASAAGARGQGVPRAPTRSCTSCAPSPTTALGAADPASATSSTSRLELMLADLEVVERRLERLEASIKKQRKDDGGARSSELLGRLKIALEAETPLRAVTPHGRRGAAHPRLHLPVAEADPALRQSRREGDRRRDRA